MDHEKKRTDSRRRTGGKPQQSNRNMRDMLNKLERKLSDSIVPESLTDLNSFERKLVHRHFDHNALYETRTYRNGDSYTLHVYPVGNIESFAQEKAEESRTTGEPVDLPAMGSYERYLVHNILKDVNGIETLSHGEGRDRHIQIISKKFGRGLRKIAKKIRLM